MKTSPLAPSSPAILPPIAGIKLAVAESAIRYKDRPDLLLAAFAPGTSVAGVLTQSNVVAAPVTWCREVLSKGHASALIVNAGNANAFTGPAGMESVLRVTGSVAATLQVKPGDVLMASTGVIGEPLQDDKITALVPQMADALQGDCWSEAAEAIRTTDTFSKLAARTVRIDGTEVRLNGIAKGSGMIAPNMATLLAFVFTDAAIPADILGALLTEANAVSFNCITVDGDTSTNDTLLAFATGQAGHTPVNSVRDVHLAEFRTALTELLTDLAIQVVRDGEGAQKLVTIAVTGAESDEAARTIGLTVANSPLVKTAIAGEDANWGRIVAAAGRSGGLVEQSKLEVTVGGVPVARDGARVANYDEAPVALHMKGTDIRIGLNLHLGKGAATVYTCDLTHGYIDINGSYRS